jgi:hypothetical protein
MGVSTEFVEMGRGLLIRCSGAVNGSEFIECKESLKNDREARGIAFALIDLEEVKQLRMTAEEVRRLARIDHDLAKNAPDVVVAVAAPSDHVFGIARMWESSAEATGWRTGVFRSRSEAEAWLNEELCSPGAK